jgi:hypothetical protein
MKIFRGNIWQFHKDNNFIVIPTNMGFTKDNVNVMGRGIAYQAKIKHSNLPEWYGKVLIKRLQNNDNRNLVIENNHKLILFPTKKLDIVNPQHSWQQNSDLETIEQSCIELKSFAEKNKQNIYLPLVGCGNGKLNQHDVLPILEKYFSNLDNIFLVENT